MRRYTLDGHDLTLMLKLNDGSRIMSIIDENDYRISIGVCVLDASDEVLAEVYYADYQNPFKALQDLSNQVPQYHYEFNIYLSGILYAMKAKF